MDFDRRKLFLDPITFNISISIDCAAPCDPNVNRDGVCPNLCMSRCSNCKIPWTAVIFPPPESPPAPGYHQNKTHKTNLLLFISVSVFAAALFILCCYAAYRFYQKRRRRPAAQDEERGEIRHNFLDEEQGPVVDHPIWYIRTDGLQPSIINSITVCRYKRGEGLVESTECSVCLNEFREDETLRLLPNCNHAFHIPCIDTWLRSHTNCPMCRAEIVAAPPRLPAPEAERSGGSSVDWEDRQPAIAENSEGLREGETADSELEVENGGKSAECSEEEASDSGNLGFVRRSVSTNSLSASVIGAAMAGNSGPQFVKVMESDTDIAPKKVDIDRNLLKTVGGSSIGRSLQGGPLSIKRSLSCSGKVFLSRYSRSRRNSLSS